MITTTTTGPDGRVVAKPFSWSYSRIKNFETCPRRYNEIDNLKNFNEPKSQELADGFVVHDAMAKRITQAIPLPPTMPYEHWIHYAIGDGGLISAETKLAITAGFKPCTYFDKIRPVWLRTVADVLVLKGDLAHIIDWKTGKVKPDPEQLLLIATCVMVHHPEIYRIRAELVWLGHNTKTNLECTVDDIVKFWGDTMFEKVRKLEQAHDTNSFPPKTSGLCRAWCVVTSCEHCGR